MSQTLNIFKKDVRYLWLEIAVTLLAAASFAFIGAGRAAWLRDPGQTRTVAWELVTLLLPLACLAVARR